MADEEDFEYVLSGDDAADGGSSSQEEEEETEEEEEEDNEDSLLDGTHPIPPIHNQEGDMCAFHALTFAAEMELRRRVPATDITFNVESFVADYEREIGMNLAQQTHLQAATGQISEYHREYTGLKLLRRDGVLARSAAWGGAERRLRISSYRVHRNVQGINEDPNGVSFSRVAELIMQRRPVVGIIRHCGLFDNLGAGGIYEYVPRSSDATADRHAVVIVGFGVRAGRDYLVVANSHGIGFGDNGFGRVYFTSVYNDRFYTLAATPPEDRPSSSTPTTSRFFDVGSTSSAAPTAPHFDDGSTFSSLLSSPSGIHRFFHDDDSTFFMNPSATRHSLEDGSASSASASQSFFVGSTSSTVQTFDAGSTNVVTTDLPSSSTAPISSSTGPTSPSTTPSSSAAPTSSSTSPRSTGFHDE